MKNDPLSDAKIIESWNKNAPSWVTAVRDGQIESRRQVTDHAIVDVVMSRSPRTVLDIGCGEGWLARELAARDIHVIGIDAVPQLIEEAKRAGGGDFRVVSYEQLSAGAFQALVDVVVCNFALLGKESVEGVFKAVPSLLHPHGSFIIQTLHPVSACGDLAYRDGWREGSWAGFSSDFSDPAPWYFRTLESWSKLFMDNRFRLLEVREPLSPKTLKPASVIFIAELVYGSLLAGIDEAFGACQRPEHFIDFTHCEECADHDELLCSRDRSTLSIRDVGNPVWDPIYFCRPEGIAYYMPALARIALEEPMDEFGWYGSQLVSHLSPQNWPSPFYEFCNPNQRKAVASLFSHFLEFHFSSPDFDADEVTQAYERWKKRS